MVGASLAVKWLVEEDDSDKARAALQSWVAGDVTRIAPHLMPFEVANALHRRVLRNELTVGDSIRMMARLQVYPRLLSQTHCRVNQFHTPTALLHTP